MVHDATYNVIHSIANNWFTACLSVLDMVEDTVIAEDKPNHIYYVPTVSGDIADPHQKELVCGKRVLILLWRTPAFQLLQAQNGGAQ
ncbi:hypothetical protein NC652_041127 [Populus alba x Populus x berolinensis]|nr:hypothetical protein NC652_041127 [Populus alba x Populus x berolinensis]